MILTWSKYEKYNKCPFQFYLLYGSKEILGEPLIPFQTNKYIEMGKKKHELFEKALKALVAIKQIPETIQKDVLWRDWWTPTLEAFVRESKDVVIEQKIGVDAAWETHLLGDYYKPCIPIETSMIFQGSLDFVMFDNPRARAKNAIIIDWKSGKARKSVLNPDQLAIYALMAFLTWRNLENITCVYFFIDQKMKDKQLWRKSDIPKLKSTIESWFGTINRRIEMNHFEKTPKPSVCKWCPADQTYCEHAGTRFC